MFARAVRIFTVRGIDVRLDPSLVLLAIPFAWAFAGRFSVRYDPTVAWTMAGVGVLLVFASILAHELAHALEARHRDIEVAGITLLMFGGVTEMHAHGDTPRDEFAVAAVGPYVSLLCGAVFGLAATYAPDLPGGAGAPIAEVAGLLAWLNVLLAVFNLLPAAPLDGGRVLRAGVWWGTKNRDMGVRVAARAGQLLALALIGLGLWTFATAGPGSTISAVVWLVIGFFLWSAARTELRQAELDRVLDRHRITDLFDPRPDPVPADRRLDLVDHASTGIDLLPVVDGDRLVGVLSIAELAGLDQTDRAMRTAGDLVRPVGQAPAIDLDTDLRTLITALAGDNDIAVLERDGRPVAVVTEREVARALHVLRAAGAGRPGRGRGRSRPDPTDPRAPAGHGR